MVSDPSNQYVQEQLLRIRRMQEDAWRFFDEQSALAWASTREAQRLDKLTGFLTVLTTAIFSASMITLGYALAAWAEKACR